MIFNSIKWRLQIWYGLILVAVLAGFGLTAWQLERGRLVGRIDNELHRRVGVLAKALHRPSPRGVDGSEPPFDRPPPDQFPDDGPPGQGLRPSPQFHLPPEAVGLFGTNDPNDFYFIIERRDGRELARSDNVPPREVDFQHEFNADERVASMDNLPAPRAALNFNHNRGIVQRLPLGETIYVGCSVLPELRELKMTKLVLSSVGGIILLLGLAGGWWLASRAIRPIDDISATAAKISSGDLSQRIRTSDTESELGRLATVLNSTFARLEASFAQQAQFTSDAAHELRTPVSVILTQAQSTLKKERTVAEYKETLEACERAATRMRRLTESLLQLARLDAGQEALRREPFNLAAIAQNCAELLQPIAAEKHVTIHTELAEAKCIGDSDRIAQVITNLLTNAIKYNKEAGEVRVATRSDNGLAILTVTNTGAGISAEDLPRVFERFYRADKARSSSEGNAGLGLAICKAVVEAHGGTIAVNSRAGEGATFEVRLPG